MKISIACLGLIKLQSEFEKQFNAYFTSENKEFLMNTWCEILELLASLEFPHDKAKEEHLKEFLPTDIAFCTDIRCSEFFSNISLEEEKCIYSSFRYILMI